MHYIKAGRTHGKYMVQVPSLHKREKGGSEWLNVFQRSHS